MAVNVVVQARMRHLRPRWMLPTDPHLVIDDEGVSGEGDHSHFFGPFLIAHLRIADHLVRQMGSFGLSNPSDLQGSHRHSAMWTIDVGV